MQWMQSAVAGIVKREHKNKIDHADRRPDQYQQWPAIIGSRPRGSTRASEAMINGHSQRAGQSSNSCNRAMSSRLVACPGTVFGS